MLMVIRVQAAVKNVVRKMNNALTTIITNTAARPPGDLESMPLFSSVSRCKAFSFQGCTLLLYSFRCRSGCCIPCKRKVLFLSLQSFTYGVITPIVILGFQKGSKQRFCTPLCRTKSVVSECKSLLLTCIIMLSLWLSSL